MDVGFFPFQKGQKSNTRLVTPHPKKPSNGRLRLLGTSINMEKKVFACQMRTQSSSQNDRKVEGERGLWKSSDPTPLLKQGHLEVVAQDHVQIASKYLPRI